MGPGMNLQAENHKYSHGDIRIKRQRFERSFIKIEGNFCIGANAAILAGVTICKGPVIANCSVTTKDVPPDPIVAAPSTKCIKPPVTYRECEKA